MLYQGRVVLGVPGVNDMNVVMARVGLSHLGSGKINSSLVTIANKKFFWFSGKLLKSNSGINGTSRPLIA